MAADGGGFSRTTSILAAVFWTFGGGGWTCSTCGGFWAVLVGLISIAAAALSDFVHLSGD